MSSGSKGQCYTSNRVLKLVDGAGGSFLNIDQIVLMLPSSSGKILGSQAPEDFKATLMVFILSKLLDASCEFHS